MNIAIKVLSWAALCCVAGTAAAQQAAPAPKPANAQAEAGESRADTSGPGPSPTQPPPPPAPAAAAPGADRGGTTGPAAAGRAAPAARPATGSGSAPKGVAKADRLDLGTATVTGDREQPKVMYIVPWKRSDIGDLAGRPMNSLVDEVLSPVDRDVFKREVVYYRAVQADASQNGAAPKPGAQGEK